MVGADICAPRAQISEKGVVKEENKKVEFWKDGERGLERI